MTIYLTGDTHGMMDDPERFEVWNFPEGEDLTRDDYLIVLGDFALPFDLLENNADLRRLAAKPWTTLFIDGNHEFFPYLEDLPVTDWKGGTIHRYPRYKNIIHLMRGEIYDIDGSTFFCMGGASSIDRAVREPEGLWFPEELPDEWEYDRAEKNLASANWEVDYVLTHTCSNRMLEAALHRTAMPGLGILTDELTDFLDELEDRLEYKQWFFGHFHDDSQLDGKHTVMYQEIVDLEDYWF